VNRGSATATDTCALGAISGIRSDGHPLNALYPLETTLITWTAFYAAGNSSSCTQKITVKDSEAPALNIPPPIVVEFASDAGAPVSYVVTSSDNCPGVTHSCAPASGSTFPIGVTTVTCTALDLAGNSTTRSFTVTVLGARGTKQDVLADMTALRATLTDKQDVDKITKAIDWLTQSLDASLWIDQTHITDDKALQNEKNAVNVLRDVINNHTSTIADGVLQGFVDRIVKCDRLLATTAIADAVALGKDVTKANAERAAGDADVANAMYDSGVERYRNAWSQAKK